MNRRQKRLNILDEDSVENLENWVDPTRPYRKLKRSIGINVFFMAVLLLNLFLFSYSLILNVMLVFCFVWLALDSAGALKKYRKLIR